MGELSWEDALVHLHEMGWDTDDIDSACETVVEACTDGDFEGSEPTDLSRDELEQILGRELEASERHALVRLASMHGQQDDEGEALREALWDLDEFAYGRSDD